MASLLRLCMLACIAALICLSTGASAAKSTSASSASSTVTEKVEIAFTDNAYSVKDTDSPRTLTYPQTFESAGSVSYDTSKHLHVKLTFAADSVKPKSLFALVQSTKPAPAGEDEKDVMFPLKVDKEDANVYSLKLSLGSSELIESLDGPNSYTITLIYGDASRKTVQWKISTVSLNLPAPSRRDVDALFVAKPLIHHQFRPAESRATLIPLIFTFVILIPFLGLLYFLSTQGHINISLPSNPTEFLYAAIFQASILAILLSFTLYWLSLNIFQAMALSATCGIVAVFSGTSALRLLHQRVSRKQESKEE